MRPSLKNFSPDFLQLNSSITLRKLHDHKFYHHKKPMTPQEVLVFESEGQLRGEILCFAVNEIQEDIFQEGMNILLGHALSSYEESEGIEATLKAPDRKTLSIEEISHLKNNAYYELELDKKTYLILISYNLHTNLHNKPPQMIIENRKEEHYA